MAMRLKSLIKGVNLFFGRVKTVFKTSVHLFPFLRLNVMLHGGFRNRTNGTGVIRPAPQCRETAFQGREFIPKDVTCITLQTGNDFGNTFCGVMFYKNMNMIRHYFERMNCKPNFGCLAVQKFSKSAFDVSNQYFTAIFRTPDNV